MNSESCQFEQLSLSCARRAELLASPTAASSTRIVTTLGGLKRWASFAMARKLIIILSLWTHTLLSLTPALAQPAFETQELPTQLGVGYAVRLLDVNRDDHLDIAIVDAKRVLWLAGPDWTEHVIYETPDAQYDNVCFAPHDIDGDGLVDFALGADWQPGNADSGGTIGWLQHTASGPWIYHPLASEPTTHRMNWITLGDSPTPSLVVAPLKGRGTRPPGFDQAAVRLLAFDPPPDPRQPNWDHRVLTEQLHVMHNFEASDLDDDGRSEIIAASYEGVTWIRTDQPGEDALQRLGAGQQTPAPARGASEIRAGKLAGGIDYLATIEPWHGDKVVVYLPPESWQRSAQLWSRHVIDDQLAWGHAVACANLDDDADQELIIGVRDNLDNQSRCGLRIYDAVDAAQGQWSRTLVDPGGVAIEDLAVGDLDSDGDVDIVAVGRATHNVRIYWNQRVK